MSPVSAPGSSHYQSTNNIFVEQKLSPRVEEKIGIVYEGGIEKSYQATGYMQYLYKKDPTDDNGKIQKTPLYVFSTSLISPPPPSTFFPVEIDNNIKTDDPSDIKARAVRSKYQIAKGTTADNKYVVQKGPQKDLFILSPTAYRASSSPGNTFPPSLEKHAPQLEAEEAAVKNAFEKYMQQHPTQKKPKTALTQAQENEQKKKRQAAYEEVRKAKRRPSFHQGERPPLNPKKSPFIQPTLPTDPGTSYFGFGAWFSDIEGLFKK